uniref:Cytoskeleton-associated protein 5 n=1 Tax=Tetraselmis sp. GSL018 TaxID=582737 RepID=A0A061RZH6_9CHLO|eukprot:CAMPEP_0177612884 /NCGR_PEP_ID=MMETSP0419_2-20121207/21568_1 /TAXON_ID=582737 /ORGANISM="Tetraselmis sp., Strain GSL018" /LENGTH=2086 /DNA_ID=CAMNT_0019109321 /DNA_START=143 /DNA_END=6403 /DNA_ORIENTATION=-
MEGDGGAAAAEEAKALTAARSLPWQERLTHSNWKVRSEACEDIQKAASGSLGTKDPKLEELADLLPKAVGDTNANVMDKGLDAAAAVLLSGEELHAARCAEDVCKVLMTKGLTARPATQKKVEEVLLLLVEQGQQAHVVDALIAGFNHKVPKAVSAAVGMALTVYSEFGAKTVKPQPILKALPQVFDSKDVKARSSAKKLTLVLGQWVGRELVESVLLEKMRDAMKKEVGEWLADLPSEKPQATRLTRKEQERRAKAEAARAAAGAADTEAGAPEDGAVKVEVPAEAPEADDDDVAVDSYEIAEPVDILRELKGSFWSGLESAKWQERKESLQLLKGLASAPRLAPGEYSDVNTALRKVIMKDSNVVCVSEAVQCTGCLAKGLRPAYKNASLQFLPLLLDKLKEKNSSVVSACQTSLAHMEKYCFQLPDVVDDIQAALSHTNPKVKQETLKFLVQTIKSRDEPFVKRLHKGLLPLLAKCVEEPTPALREAAMACLAEVAAKAGSMGPLEKALSGVDDAKKKKLTSMAQAAMSGEDTQLASAPPSPGHRSVPGPPASRPATAAPAGRTPAASGSRPSSARPRPKTASSAPSAAASAAESDDPVALNSTAPSGDEAIAKLEEAVGEAVVKGLRSVVWKERLEAMTTIQEKVSDLASSGSCADQLVFGLAALPGWGEKNFQVMGKCFEVCGEVAKLESSGFRKPHAFALLSGVVEKISDNKLKGPGTSAITSAAEAVGPAFMIGQVHKKASAHNNPKVHSESLEWINTTVLEFGLSVCGKNLVDMAKSSLASPNAAVRSSATKLVATMHRYLGPGLIDVLKPDLKPALLSAIETEIASNTEPAPEPCRASRTELSKKPAPVPASGKPQGKAKKVCQEADDDMLPRTDISGQITGRLLKELASGAWKERQAAIEQVNQVVAGAGGRIGPNVGDLLPALKQRLTDSNRNLAAGALHTLAAVCKAMGPAFERQGRAVLDGAVRCLGDNKKQVRDAVLGFLDAFLEVGGGSSIFPEIADGLKTLKVEGGKMETLCWLSSKVSAEWLEDQASIAAAITIAVAGIEDKAATVRAAGTTLLEDIVRACGGPAAQSALKEMDDPARRAALPHVNKVVGSQDPRSPARPPSAAASAPPSGSAKGSARPSTAPANSSLRKSIAPPTAKTLKGHASPSKAAEPADSEPPFVHDDKKDVRAQRRRGGFKPLNNLNDEIADLEAALATHTSPAMHKLMFSKDCPKHIQACDIVVGALVNHNEVVHSNMDHILHWLRIRMGDGNTQCLVKNLETLHAIFSDMEAQGVALSDYEASIILPSLAERSGHNQDRIRQKHRELLSMSSNICSRHIKLADALLEGVRSKNNRTRVECVEELGCLVERHGVAALKVSGKEKVLPTVAKMVSERDKALRGAVLGMLSIVYVSEGDVVWKQMGSLDNMQKSLIEDRFKFTDKEAKKTGTIIGDLRSQRMAERDGPPEDTSQAVPSGRVSPAQEASPEKQRPPVVMEVDLQQPVFRRSAVFQGQPRPAPEDGQGRSAISGGRSAIAAPPAVQQTPPQQARPEPSPLVMTQMPSGPASKPRSSANRTPEEVLSSWAHAMEQLESDNLQESVDGMKLFCFELMEASKGTSEKVVAGFCKTADRMVSRLTSRVDLVFDEATAVALREGSPPSSRSCKYVLNTLMQTLQFQGRTLALCLNQQTVEALMERLLLRLLDDRVNLLQEGGQLLKALNVLMLKILDNSNRTHVFSALLSLLRCPPQPLSASDSASARTQEQKFVDLVVKCLIKLTKALENFIDELDIGAILLAVHNFFHKLGAEEIRRRGAEDDKPLRMVKTVLHEICKYEGHGVQEVLVSVVPRDPAAMPIIHNYVDLNLQTLMAAGSIPRQALLSQSSATPVRPQQDRPGELPSPSPQAPAPPKTPATPAESPHPAPSPAPTPASATPTPSARSAASTPSSTPATQAAKQALASIFKKIGDRECTEQGLKELYHFQRSNPHVDVDYHLSRTSNAFRTYIQDGLNKVEQQEQRRAMASEAGTSSSVKDDGASISQRMARLRGRFADTSVSASADMGRAGTQNLDELRERMKQIQSQMPSQMPTAGTRNS